MSWVVWICHSSIILDPVGHPADHPAGYGVQRLLIHRHYLATALMQRRKYGFGFDGLFATLNDPFRRPVRWSRDARNRVRPAFQRSTCHCLDLQNWYCCSRVWSSGSTSLPSYAAVTSGHQQLPPSNPRIESHGLAHRAWRRHPLRNEVPPLSLSSWLNEFGAPDRPRGGSGKDCCWC